MDTKHTPTPWVQDGTHLYDKDDNCVADCLQITPNNFDEANAAFIVRACNAYDELVAALIAVKDQLGYCEFDDRTIDLINSSLAKARGEQ